MSNDQQPTALDAARDEFVRKFNSMPEPIKHILAEPLKRYVEAMAADARHQLLNTPELRSFSEGVTLEALHQRQRWGSEHDAGKTPADWFWLVGYLAGKALHAQTSGNTEKALHHTISTAAALANWHASITGADTAMRPGIDPVTRGVETAPAPSCCAGGPQWGHAWDCKTLP